MSAYAYVAEHARKVFASVSRLESDLARSPDDWGAQRNLRSMQKLAAQARTELERLAALNHVEVCDYRLVPEGEWRYALEHVSNSFLQYQWLFSQIYDAIRNGPKSRARIGSEAAQESALDFAFSYSGSLGVVLLAQSEREFFEGNLDKSVEALFQVMDIKDGDTVRDVSHSLGRAVVKRVHDWSAANVKGEYAADVQWKLSNGKLLGQMVSRDHMEQIVSVINATADETTKNVEVLGMLVAVSIPARSFHISVPDGDSLTGHFDDDFVVPSEFHVGRMYYARIRVSDTYRYATEQHVLKNALLDLTIATTENLL